MKTFPFVLETKRKKGMKVRTKGGRKEGKLGSWEVGKLEIRGETEERETAIIPTPVLPTGLEENEICGHGTLK